MARAFSLTAIAAIGQTMVIITGGIDLSAGSIIGLSSLSTGMLLVNGWPSVPAILAGLAVGTAFGACNGLLITRVGLPPFIATLGTLSIGRGLIYVITQGYPVTAPRDPAAPADRAGLRRPGADAGDHHGGGHDRGHHRSSPSRPWGATSTPSAATRRRRGWPGSTSTGSRCSSTPSSGFLASVSGIILLSRLVSAQPSAGLGQELPVIAASIIGGTSLIGGEGTALGAVLGAAIVGVLENGIVLLGINTYAQQVVTGAVILLAVGLDIWQKRRERRVVVSESGPS